MTLPITFRNTSAYILCLLILAGFSGGYAQDLRSVETRADYVLITSADYRAQAERLASFRETNDGFASMVVVLDSIFAQFTTTPSADSSMKEFIAYALDFWQDPKPQYFVLLGNVNAVPTHVEPEYPWPPGISHRDSICIDHWFVEGESGISGSAVARAVLGRLPAWDSTSLAVMVDKVITYENLEPEAWWGRSVGLVDSADHHAFEADMEALQGGACGHLDRHIDGAHGPVVTDVSGSSELPGYCERGSGNAGLPRPCERIHTVRGALFYYLVGGRSSEWRSASRLCTRGVWPVV